MNNRVRLLPYCSIAMDAKRAHQNLHLSFDLHQLLPLGVVQEDFHLDPLFNSTVCIVEESWCIKMLKEYSEK
jgi:hypothetical protein